MWRTLYKDVSSTCGMCCLHIRSLQFCCIPPFRLNSWQLVCIWAVEYNHSHLLHTSPPYRTEIQAHIYSWNADRSIIVHYVTHKVVLYHFWSTAEVRPPLSVLCSQPALWYAKGTPLSVIAGDNYLEGPGNRLKRPSGTKLFSDCHTSSTFF